MWRCVWQIEEERLVVSPVSGYKFRRVVAESIGNIKALFWRRVRLVVNSHLAFDTFGFGPGDVKVVGKVPSVDEIRELLK